MTRIVLAGGAGFIGQAVTARLKKIEFFNKITVIGRSLIPRHALPKGVEYIVGDVKDEKFLIGLLKSDDYVIDLCHSTVPKTSFENPPAEIERNMITNITLMQRCALLGIRKYLYVSSGGTVYGNNGIGIQKEYSQTNPISPYGMSKLFTEKFVLFYNVNFGLQGIIVRPSNPYGIEQIGNRLQGFIGSAIDCLINKKPIHIFGKTGTIRDYIYNDDLADGIIKSLQCGQKSDIFNIGTGIGYNNIEIITAIEKIFEKKFSTIEIQPNRSFDVKRNILSSDRLKSRTDWTVKHDIYAGLEKLKGFIQ